jgi:hypothetical protein
MAVAGPIRVFISYRRDDTAGHAGRLYDSLVARLGGDAHVFMDVDDIEPGVDFTEVLHDAVTSCDVMLALIGPRWSVATATDGSRRLDDPSDYLVNEIGVALERNVRVIPILVDGAPMPAMTELPDRLKTLVRRNAMWLRTTTWRPDAESIFEVLDHIRAPLPQPPPVAVTTPSPSTVPLPAPPPHAPLPSNTPPQLPTSPRSKKPLWIALGALAAVIALVAVVVSMSGSDSASTSSDDGVITGFRFAPASGPIGTDIHMKSSEPCPEHPVDWLDDYDDYVDVVVWDPRLEEQTLDGTINSTVYSLENDRSWAGEIDIPDGATEGTLELRVTCTGTNPDGEPESFRDYTEYFELTLE